MGKTMCKIKESKKTDVTSPKFKCKDCDELAEKKKQLCEPRKMKK